MTMEHSKIWLIPELDFKVFFFFSFYIGLSLKRRINDNNNTQRAIVVIIFGQISPSQSS